MALFAFFFWARNGNDISAGFLVCTPPTTQREAEHEQVLMLYCAFVFFFFSFSFFSFFFPLLRLVGNRKYRVDAPSPCREDPICGQNTSRAQGGQSSSTISDAHCGKKGRRFVDSSLALNFCFGFFRLTVRIIQYISLALTEY